MYLHEMRVIIFFKQLIHFSICVFIALFFLLLPTESTLAQQQNSGEELLKGFPWVNVAWDSDQMTISLSGIQSEHVRILELSQPFRIVFDIPHLKYSGKKPLTASYDFSSGLLKQLRATSSDSGTKIVLESKFELYLEQTQDITETCFQATILLRFRQTIEEMEIDEGTIYIAKRYVTPSGQRFAHAVISDKTRSFLRPRVVFASDFTYKKIAGLSSITDGSRAAAAINGGFFSWPGTSLSLVIQDTLIKSPPLLHRPAFMVLKDGSYKIDYPKIKGLVRSSYGVEWEVDFINMRPGPGKMSLITPIYPQRLRNNMEGTKAVIKDKFVEYVTDGEIIDFTDRTILWSRKAYPPLTLLSIGEEVETKLFVDPKSPPIMHAIQGGPLLLYNDHIYTSTALEDFGPDITRGRSARTAVGIDGSGKIFLLVIEGPNSERSIGATIDELALTMKDLGAKWAMALDGGSSSAMCLGFHNPNTSLPSGTRGVNTALILLDESGRMQGSQFYF